MNAKTIALTKPSDKNWTGTFTFTQPAPEHLVLDGQMDGHKLRMETRLVDRNSFLLVKTRLPLDAGGSLQSVTASTLMRRRRLRAQWPRRRPSHWRAAGAVGRVLEAQPTIGGGTRSAELTEPGFVHDVCSTVHASCRSRRSCARCLWRITAGARQAAGPLRASADDGEAR